MQELVIIAVKAHALAAAAPAIAALLGPRTILLPAQNGIPWWFAYTAPAACLRLCPSLQSILMDGSPRTSISPESSAASFTWLR